MIATPREILDFWFRETPPERWFKPDTDFDRTVKDKFVETWRAGRDGGLDSWRDGSDGVMALILLFDQFPRNMFRGTADAFASDPLAREVARLALQRGYDLEAPVDVRSFFYLPFMHSESDADQELCLGLTRERLGEGHYAYPYARRHRDVIARFGRFPARNLALGRATTAEEAEFLDSHKEGF